MSQITDLAVKVLNLGNRQLAFVRISDSDGLEGYGEVTLAGQTRAILGLLDYFRDYLVGQDPNRIGHHWQHLYRCFWQGGPTLLTTISGVEIAMWDLLGKRLGVSVYQLLGGAVRDQIRVYTHFFGPDGATLASEARRVAGQGWRTLKTFVNLAKREDPDHDPIPGILETMVHVRQALGSQVELCFDCHGRFGYADAMRLSRGLADLNFCFIEEPIGPENAALISQFAAHSPTPVAMGERLYDLTAFGRVLMEGNLAYIQPDAIRCGGVSVVHTVAKMAGALQVGFAPHNSPGTGPVGTAAALHLAAASHSFSMLEHRDHWTQEEEQVFHLSLDLEDGHLPLPTGPGLGLKVEWEAMDSPEQAPLLQMPRSVLPDGTVMGL
jgi:galactonate dehydratase